MTDWKQRFETLIWIKHPDGRLELDLGWAILILCCLVGIFVFLLEALTPKSASIAAWTWFGAFTSMAFIAGTTLARARLIAESKAPGEVATAIATAQPDLYRDDERGEHTEREPVA